MRRTLALAAIVASLVPACASSSTPERVQPSVQPAPPAESPTPAVEPTGSPSPEPQAEPPRFGGRVLRLPVALEAEMRGTTWKPGCPVPLSHLRLLRFNYWGFHGVVKRGPMVVNASVADDVLWVFRQLFDAQFPLKHVDLSTPFHPKAFAQHRRISSNRSVTASFNCRPVVTALGPGGDFSQHAYGLAIDVNPLQNPYVTSDGFVRNRMAERYLNRSRHLEGMIHDGDVVFRSFAAIGWEWGGHWSGDKDYMHFSLLGR